MGVDDIVRQGKFAGSDYDWLTDVASQGIRVRATTKLGKLTPMMNNASVEIEYSGKKVYLLNTGRATYQFRADEDTLQQISPGAIIDIAERYGSDTVTIQEDSAVGSIKTVEDGPPGMLKEKRHTLVKFEREGK